MPLSGDKPHGKTSLTALAASLDTRKRAAPEDAKGVSAAVRRSPAAEDLRTEVKRAAARNESPTMASHRSNEPRTGSSLSSASRTASSDSRPGIARPAAAPAPKPTPRGDAKATRTWTPANALGREDALKTLQRGPSAGPTRVPIAAPGKPSGKAALPVDARRKYPRVELGAKARLSMSDSPDRFFEAALPTANISVGGMFLKSSFFLKLGTKLLVELTLPPKGRLVRVKGEVVRVETSDDGHAGFALRFTEYLDGSEVILATHFLSPVLREFLAAYAKQHHFETTPEYIAHTADVLAAWELRKAELGGDVWNLVQADE